MLSSRGLPCYLDSNVVLLILKTHKCVIITKKLHGIPYRLAIRMKILTLFYPINFMGNHPIWRCRSQQSTWHETFTISRVFCEIFFFNSGESY